ncbi:short-chain dehydrogenase [Flavobacterium rivuli WB 3.3-2 = DSM 21788]|uniref:Short-chain dehydrogenase n=1 Tax=Flavobacterium rivuli WB 3.3-2 = DSM 21788 TaxID=1121895 RepID=A0A0A2MA28_9FLAO|nr:SDR family oxidoreductase [Flavobacterium rivuli]KGO85130.1 short-chain dehydrogenase [Flavobacterium rivuli WB 3.3-2 = DSM 21788]
MNLHLNNKVIVISGGAKGIGAAIAKSVAAEGALPVIIGRDENDNKKLVAEIEQLGYAAGYVTAELSHPKNCKIAIDNIISNYKTIDGLVNNAGANDGVGLENGNYEGFIASLHKNVVHYYLLAQYALPALKNSKGSIVNIGSKTAETGQGGTSGYAAANGARNALTREWAVELLPYSIRVNAVIVAEAWTPLYKTWINTFDNAEEKLKSITDKIPFEKRMTKVEEIADMVAFLLSGRSAHTTGQLIHVDGGYVHLDRAL